MATLYQDDQGNWFGRICLDWDDNSELDLGGYQVECRRSDETRWRTQKVTVSEAVFEGLTVGGSYYARVKAVDKAGNESDYANFNAGSPIAIPVDTFAPATPSGLTVTAGKKCIKISVNKNTDGDWAGNEFHVSTENDFTPSAETLVHSGKTTSFVFHTTSYVTHYAKVRAYDTASTPNYSAYTAQGSATPEKVEGSSGAGDITQGTISNLDIVSLQASKITAGTLAAGVIYVGDIECEQLKAGTITAAISIQSAGTIGFVDGPQIYGGATHLAVGGNLQAIGYIFAADGYLMADTKVVFGTSLEQGATVIIDSSRNLKNVTIDPATVAVAAGTWNIDQPVRTGNHWPIGDNSYSSGQAGTRWANVYCAVLHEGDHVFEERTCPVCKKPFQKGEVLGYEVVDIGPGGTRAIPVHMACAGKAVD